MIILNSNVIVLKGHLMGCKHVDRNSTVWILAITNLWREIQLVYWITLVNGYYCTCLRFGITFLNFFYAILGLGVVTEMNSHEILRVIKHSGLPRIEGLSWIELSLLKLGRFWASQDGWWPLIRKTEVMPWSLPLGNCGDRSEMKCRDFSRLSLSLFLSSPDSSEVHSILALIPIGQIQQKMPDCKLIER